MSNAQDRTANDHELKRTGIGRLLLRYSLPAVVAMTATSLYNVIDRIFIGQGVGVQAIAGLALTLPVMNLAVAFGSMVGVGAAALTSIRLGEGRHQEAERILGNTVLLNLALGTAYSLLMFLCLDPVLRLFGASEATLPHAQQFLQVILLGNPLMHTYMGLNNIMRSSGHPRKSMFLTITTLGVNVALAPVFLFGFGWGLRGAALATVIGQACGLAIALLHFTGRRSPLRLRRANIVPDPAIVAEILTVGMSTFFTQAAASLVSAVVNLQLVRHGGDLAVGAFGIVSSLLLLVTMVGMGIAQGMQPIVGYNYGAARYPRAFRALHNAVACVTLVNIAGFLVARFLPHLLVRAFTHDAPLCAMAARAMRIVSLGLPLIGFQMLTAHFFLSIGRAKLSIVTTLSRQVGLLIPFLLVLPRFFGLAGVWMAIPASDCAAALVNASVFRYERRRILRLQAAQPAQ
jgi:putative MATE family efflux protein